jgi:hypothetical protein
MVGNSLSAGSSGAANMTASNSGQKCEPSRNPAAPGRGYVPPIGELSGNYFLRREWIPLWPWWHLLIMPRLFVFIGLPGLAHSTFRICKPIPMPGALSLYLAYAVWMLGRYRRQEQERRYIIEVLRSQG